MTQTPKTKRKSSTVVAKTPRKRSSKPALPPNPFVHEILEYVGKQKSKVSKVQALKEYRNDALVSILIWNFDETVVSMMPEGEVPFKPNESPLGTDHTSLRREIEQRHEYHERGYGKYWEIVEVPHFDGHLVSHTFYGEEVSDEKTCIYRRISARSRPAVAHQRQERPASGRRIRSAPIGVKPVEMHRR